ncbi:MAG: saccharopine dehydrogenase C-terminal domain-containing protein [Nanoarchaeota archaeon]
MRYDFAVLGATGLQGKIASRDLLESGYSVLLCGRDKSRVDWLMRHYKKTGFEHVDLRNISETTSVIKKSGAKIVINCAEGDWNLNALKACTSAGAHSLDLGSEIPMTKQQFAMHRALKGKNLIHITGCGSVPGIGNVMLRHATEDFDKIDSVEVGFAWNSNIKKFVVPFSMQSIIEEFTDPATNIENGKWKKVLPMSSVKMNHDDFVGEQEEFFVRHPETYTFYNYFKSKGLKNVRFYAEFPPHSFNVISMLIQLGFGNKEPIMVDGQKVVPVKVLTEVLKGLEIPKGYRENEDLWVDVYGKKGSIKKKIKMRCIVPTLPGWEDAGCNIDTGMTVSVMAQMIKDGRIDMKGSFAPEGVVPPDPFFKELRKRQMIVIRNGKVIN